MVKTRDKLIDIARQLFAHKGIENTTMNDIAIAAEKGRRTIYTYFKNKRDIYNAVVETESDKVLSKLSEIAKLQIPADEKLMEFIFQRFDAMKDLVHRNGSLRAGFFRDVRKVDRARAVISKKEILLLMSILHEGVACGDFEIPSVKEWAILITNAIHGIDVPYIRDSLSEYGIGKEDVKRMMTELILNGIRKR